MRNRFCSVLSVAVIVLVLFSSATRAQDAKTGATKPPGAAEASTTGAGSRDLSGVWTRKKGTPNMSTGSPVVFTPEGKAAFDANKPSYGPRTVHPALGNDPIGTCDPLGMPRSLFLEVAAGPTYEFVQVPGRVIQFFEWQHQYRTIWMDGRELPKDPDPRWNGYSVGHWDGNTLVVDSVGFEPRTWLDNWGDPHSDTLTVQERYKRVDHDTLQMELTFTDPTFLQKPWTSDPILLRLDTEKGMDDKIETFCVPTEEEEFNKRIRNRSIGANSN